MAANPRAAAVAALVRQEQDGFSNLVLDAELKRQQLEGRDKAFASAIFYTVLEHRGTLDYILCQFLPKGLAKLDAPVREILRAALARLPLREQQIMQLRFGLGGAREMTQKEVADEIGISQSYISRLEKKIISRMQKEIKKLG